LQQQLHWQCHFDKAWLLVEHHDISFGKHFAMLAFVVLTTHTFVLLLLPMLAFALML
jgi:hypothetical protein